MKKTIRLTLTGITAVALFMGASIIMPVDTQPQPASAAQTDKYDGDCTGTETVGRCADKPFDHSLCQYPDRTTNPVGGCDNSDPCDPANTKGGSGDCVTLPETNSQPVTTAAPSNQCNGGK